MMFFVKHHYVLLQSFDSCMDVIYEFLYSPHHLNLFLPIIGLRQIYKVKVIDVAKLTFHFTSILLTEKNHLNNDPTHFTWPHFYLLFDLFKWDSHSILTSLSPREYVFIICSILLCSWISGPFNILACCIDVLM